MIERYKHKPIEIEAIQWTGNNSDSIFEFCKMAYVMNDIVVVKTTTGKSHGTIGSYVVKLDTNDYMITSKEDLYNHYNKL